MIPALFIGAGLYLFVGFILSLFAVKFTGVLWRDVTLGFGVLLFWPIVLPVGFIVRLIK